LHTHTRDASGASAHGSVRSKVPRRRVLSLTGFLVGESVEWRDDAPGQVLASRDVVDSPMFIFCQALPANFAFLVPFWDQHSAF
jgi:hypothetical protein